jgi:hypothetical protein
VQEVVDIAPTIAKNAPLWIQVTKEAALTYIEAGERAAIDYIRKVREQVLNSQDMLEGLQSFVERRAAVFKGKSRRQSPRVQPKSSGIPARWFQQCPSWSPRGSGLIAASRARSSSRRA